MLSVKEFHLLFDYFRAALHKCVAVQASFHLTCVQAVFAAAVFKPALHSVCLVRFKITYTAYFKPSLLRCTIHFKVVSHSAGKAHVAAAKAQYAIRQFKRLKQALYMLYHFFQCIITVFQVFTICIISTFSNWCRRFNPRTSFP